MSGTPNSRQNHFRFRTDSDLVDNTPTWAAAEDVNYYPGTSNFRLRFAIDNTGTGNENVRNLLYSKNGGTYTQVTTSTSNVKSADASSSVDNAALATANFRLTAGAGSAVIGQYDESGTNTASTLITGGYSEYEFGLVLVPADLAPGDTLDFRMYATATPIAIYNQTPRITVPSADVTSPDKWHALWREPVRSKPGLHASAQSVLAFVKATPFPETVTEDRWHQAWSEPVRVKPGLRTAAQDELAAPVARIETITVDKWFQHLGTPPKPKVSIAAASQQFAALVKADPFPETVQEDKWHQAWSEPVRTKPRLREASQQTLAFVKADPFPESVTEDRWHQPWSEPVRVKVTLRTAAQEPTFRADPFAIDALETRWHQPWSTPVRAKVALSAAAQTSTVGPVTVTSARTVSLLTVLGLEGYGVSRGGPYTGKTPATTNTWWGGPPLSEPVRTNTRWTARTASGATGPVLNPETQITNNFESRWHQPWSDPSAYLRNRGLAAQQQRAWTGPDAPQEGEDKWHQPWSTPVRVKPGLAAHHQQFLAYSESQQFPETVQEDKWHRPWSDPSAFLTKRGLAAHQQRASTGVENVPANISWFAALSDPVRVKLRLPEASQQTLAFVKATPFPETVTESRWHQPWSEPARVKPSLRTGAQPFATRTEPFAENAFESRWHQPWSEPKRSKPGLRLGSQTHAIGPLDSSGPHPVTIISRFGAEGYGVRRVGSFAGKTAQVIPTWFGTALAEPVRFRDRWTARAASGAVGPVLNPETQIINQFESRWHQPWSQPRVLDRINPRLAVALAASGLFYSESAQFGETITHWYEPWSDPVRTKPHFTEHPPQTWSVDEPPPAPPAPPLPGAGKRKDFPSYIPQPPYGEKKKPPFRPVWDERRRRAAQAILDEEKRRTASAIPMPPAEIFQRQAPVSYPMPGQIDPAQSHLIAQQSQDARDIADVQDAMSALQSDRQDAQDAIDILSIL